MIKEKGYIDTHRLPNLSDNYIREHEGLDGKTPAEACGITVEGENEWLTLMQNAKKERAI